MENTLKEWLDNNAEVKTSAGGWSWWYEMDDVNGKKVAIKQDGSIPCVYLTIGGMVIYTDAMAYCCHGFGDGISKCNESILCRFIPNHIWEAVVEWYGDDILFGRKDLVRDCADLERDMNSYLKDRIGYTPNVDYFVDGYKGDRNELDLLAMDCLSIPHDERMDEKE